MSALWKVVLVGGGFGVRCAAQRLRSNLVDVTSPFESSRCWLAQRFRATTSPGFGERVQPLRLMAAPHHGTRRSGRSRLPCNGEAEPESPALAMLGDFRSINPEEAQILLLDGAPRVLLSFPADLS